MSSPSNPTASTKPAPGTNVVTIQTTVTLVSPVSGSKTRSDADIARDATRTARKAVTRANRVNRILLNDLSACQKRTETEQGGDKGYAFAETYATGAAGGVGEGSATDQARRVFDERVQEKSRAVLEAGSGLVGARGETIDLEAEEVNVPEAEVAVQELCTFCSDFPCHWTRTKQAALIALPGLSGCVRTRRMAVYDIYKHFRRFTIQKGKPHRLSCGHIRVPRCIVVNTRRLVKGRK